MYKFAHIADCHLGAQKYPKMKELEFLAFTKCLDKCIETKVDFIIIAGDLFHSNLPDMGVVRETIKKLKELHDNNIPVYVNYGSHDYSPNRTSIIDVISESGLIHKIFETELIQDSSGNESIVLKFIVDEKTKAKIAGISGRKIGLEKKYFQMLDRKSISKEKGFKIFVFHAWLEELIPNFLSKDDGLPISCLPKGFDYYAGGHRHDMIFEENILGYKNVAYPGPLFAGYPKDIEKNARGEKRGFFIVEFDQKNIQSYTFHEIDVANYEYLLFNANDKTSNQLYEEILDILENIEVNNKVVILKIKGQLTGGKTSDIDFNNIKRILYNKKALSVSINRYMFYSKEFDKFNDNYKGKNPFEIEEMILRENSGNIDVDTDFLRDKEGAEKAIQLLKIIKQNQKSNEKKYEYWNRIYKASLYVLGLEGML